MKDLNKWDLAIEQLQEMGHTVINDLTGEEIEELKEVAFRNGYSTFVEDTDNLYLVVVNK